MHIDRLEINFWNIFIGNLWTFFKTRNWILETLNIQIQKNNHFCKVIFEEMLKKRPALQPFHVKLNTRDSKFWMFVIPKWLSIEYPLRL